MRPFQQRYIICSIYVMFLHNVCAKMTDAYFAECADNASILMLQQCPRLFCLTFEHLFSSLF